MNDVNRKLQGKCRRSEATDECGVSDVSKNHERSDRIFAQDGIRPAQFLPALSELLLLLEEGRAEAGERRQSSAGGNMLPRPFRQQAALPDGFDDGSIGAADLHRR